MRSGKKNISDLTDASIIAIIPARGGSKGIHKKNIINVAGKPLISYMIKAAKSSKFISKIIVSTDDQEIASVAMAFNAEVIMRPSELSGDDSPSELALLHVIEHLKKTGEKVPEIIVFLQCTCPLTSSEDIDRAIMKLVSEKADASFTVTPTHYFLWTENANGEVIALNHDKNFRKRRQDIEPQFIETGSVYVMRCEGFLKHKHRFFGKLVMSVIPPERALDIDEPADIIRAEDSIRQQNEINAIKKLPQIIEGMVFDFDGVFTNNKVIVHDHGGEAVICDRSDGLGLSQIKTLNIPLLVLSTEKNPVVQVRCDKLGIPVIQNVPEKISILKKWLQEKNLNPSNVIFVGNDINDLSCIQYIGCGIAVGDAHPEVKASVKIILTSAGGNGAIRELSDLLIKHCKIK